MRGDRGGRGFRRDPAVRFTTIEVLGKNGAGPLSLASATVLGPFAPDEGDQVVSIASVYAGGPYPFDDETGFASEVLRQVGGEATLYQYDTSNLSASLFTITFARMR